MPDGKAPTDVPLVPYSVRKWVLGYVFLRDDKTVERVFWNIRQAWRRPLRSNAGFWRVLEYRHSAKRRRVPRIRRGSPEGPLS